MEEYYQNNELIINVPKTNVKKITNDNKLKESDNKIQ